MHELSIMSALFKTITATAEAHHLSNVTKVHLQIGQRRQLMPDMLDFAFETLRKDTVARSATLVVDWIPEGTELILESIEGDPADGN